MSKPARQCEDFDYAAVAATARISEGDLAAIEAVLSAEYPTDQMVFELRMLRICRAIKDGFASVGDVIRAHSGQPDAA
jgi:hypothetical protein